MTIWLSVPGAIAATLLLLGYVIGVRRPFRIKDAGYREQNIPHKVRFSCIVINRSLLWDRTLSKLALVEAAGDRSFPRRGQYVSSEQAQVILDEGEPVKIGRRDHYPIRGELSLSSSNPLQLPRLAIQAYAGHRSSRPAQLRSVGDGTETISGAELLMFVDHRLPELVVYLNEMVLSHSARRRELRLRLQEKVLGWASEGERRVTLYLNQGDANGRIDLRPELNCPGWAPNRPPTIDPSTERGRSVLNLVENGTIRVCSSLEELQSRPEYRETTRDWQRFPAYAIIPMLAGSDHETVTIGVLEVECKDKLFPVDATQLIAMASVLACAKLLETASGSY